MDITDIFHKNKTVFHLSPDSLTLANDVYSRFVTQTDAHCDYSQPQKAQCTRSVLRVTLFFIYWTDSVALTN
jgi:hypothetical protein